MGNKNNKVIDKFLFQNIKSKYIFQQICSNLSEKRILEIIKYNKNIQIKINKNINNYKDLYLKFKSYNIKFIGVDTTKNKSHLFDIIKKNEKLLEYKILLKSNDIITLKAENNKLNLIDTNKNTNLLIDYRADCIILEYYKNDIKSYEYIKTCWNEKLKDTDKRSLVYLIGIDYYIKKNKIINEDNTIQKFASLLRMNLKFFDSKNNNINNILSKIEYDIIERKKIKDSYTIIFLGSTATGKTSLINRIIYNDFDKTIPTEGTKRSFKTIELINGQRVILTLWDYPGNEKYKNLAKFIYKTADIIVLVFDKANKKSFNYAKDLLFEIDKDDCLVKTMYLIGCKSDLYDKYEVSKDEAIHFAKEYNLIYFEISNKDNIGINEFIDSLAEEIIN